MNIRVTHSDIQATGTPVPDFPWLRFDTGQFIYNEALAHGRYLVAGLSAMGRPMSRAQVWDATRPPAESGGVWHPRAPWQSAFRLVVDGQALVDRWEWVGADETPSGREGCLEHEVRLRHTVRPFETRLCTRLDGTSLISRWVQVTNTGSEPAAVSEAFTWSGRVWSVGQWPNMPLRTDPPFSLGRFRSAMWGREGEFAWEPLPRGTLRLDSEKGRSGWGAPFFLLRNESTGENLIGHLAWSGNWAIDFLLDDDSAKRSDRQATLYVRAGIAGTEPLRVIEPSETATLPALHLGYQFGDLDACVQELHDHLRRSVIPSLPEGVPHPVGCNHTGYTRNAQITEECLSREIDAAADVGVELFIIDAGWFGGTGSSWAQQVGDWEETPLLKHGMKALCDHIRSKGMKCGLWVEAERMAPTSKTAQAHPGWFMQRRGIPIHQLDLARPQVARHLEDTITRLVEKYELDCFRLDYNISPHEGSEREVAGPDGTVEYVESTMWRYYDTLWGIFDRLRKKFPGLLLENCSGGGGRTDLGMLSRFHWTQVTDNWDPQNTLKIVNGMTLSLPPEQVMTLLGSISWGVADLDFMLRIGLFGHFCVSGIYPSPEEAHAESIERWRHTIGIFRDFVRPFLHQSRIFHHTPILSQSGPDEWCVLEMVSPGRDRGIAGIWRFPGASGDGYRFRPKGLSPSRTYRVIYDNTAEERAVDGGTLMDDGILAQVGATGCSELLLFEATP